MKLLTEPSVSKSLPNSKRIFIESRKKSMPLVRQKPRQGRQLISRRTKDSIRGFLAS